MSVWDFIGGFSETMLSDMERRRQAELEAQREQRQLDFLEASTRMRARIEQEYQPPQRRQFRDDKTGGLMEVDSKWDPESQSYQDFGEPQQVRPTMIGRPMRYDDGGSDVIVGLMSDGALQELARGKPKPQRPTAAADTSYRQRNFELDARKQAATDARQVRELPAKQREQMLAPYSGDLDTYEKARLEHYMGGGGRNDARPAPAPAAPRRSGSDEELQQVIDQARQAIQRGAPRDAVIQRLKEAFPGVDFGSL